MPLKCSALKASKPLGIVVVLLVAWLLAMGFSAQQLDRVELSYPEAWPKPEYNFKRSPLSQQGIDLGRALFYDPILSRNNTTSCSTCHLSYTAFTHVDHALSHGINDSIGTRNSPVLVNLAWNKLFMWDGAVNHLDVQALAPIAHPAEMGNSIEAAVASVQAQRKYRGLFHDAFGDSTVTGERLLKALSQFQLTLVSANSKYDKVMRQEPDVAFTEQEARGYQLFQQHCNSCHTEPLFTNGAFANNGLLPDSTLNDPGRMGITQRKKDSLKFKVPTLRNIEFSFPYMHDGRFVRLGQVMRHYTKEVYDTPTLAPELRGNVPLTEVEQLDIIAFLFTLTDKEFLFNPDHAFPRPSQN